MGLFDFLKKGEEKPAQKPVTPPKAQPANPAAAGNAAPAAPASQQAAKPKETTYTVQKGDSLSKIAKQFYGDMNKWNKIFEANKAQVKDPNLIHPGQQLRIPLE